MKSERECKYCSKFFRVENREINRGGGVFCSKNCSNLHKRKENQDNFIVKECNSPTCNNKINYKDRKNSFCSRTCANSRTWSEEFKQKLSATAKNSEKIQTANKKRAKTPEKIITCRNCSKEVITRKDLKFCNKECRDTFRISNTDNTINGYRKQCSFKFNLRDFEDEFDFKLIEEFGWYSPSNKNNNLEGVSRDHMFSVKHGFTQGISPYIISHPANCRLITQRDNSKKHSSSLITLEELKVKIEEWNNRYKQNENNKEI
jgi:ribosomal protein S16